MGNFLLRQSEKMMQKNKPVDEMSFEVAFNELESIVSALEAEEHNLEDSLALFERGQILARHCASLLDAAELKVQQIVGDDLTDFQPNG
jgi:exodeoxyribonuclease VII small subunit